MKKITVLTVSAALLFSACGTYTGDGAFMGASLGSVIGSAVGGISGGWRGSDIGTLVGMAGGAVVGGALGAQADKAQQQQQDYGQDSFDERYRQHRAEATDGSYGGYNGGNRDNRSYSYSSSEPSDGTYQGGGRDDNESGFDPTGSGDDTLYDFKSSDYTGDYTASQPEHVAPTVRYDEIKAQPVAGAAMLEVRNARFVDDGQDHAISPGETGKLIFEVYNVSENMVYDIQPMVVETSGNKQVRVSGTVHVESIIPGKGIRYTAMVLAGKRLKGDNLVFRVYALQGNGKTASNTMEFDIPIKRK